MHNKSLLSLAIIALSGIVVLSGCDLFAGDAGRITVKLKDAPFPYDVVSEANVTIKEIHVLGTSGTRNWLIADVSQPLNLMDLRDGVSTTIVPDVEIPAGTYDRIRIRIDQAAELVLSNGARHAANSGSEAQLDLSFPQFKFNQSEDDAEVLVDFDMDASFTAQGDPATAEGITGFTYSPVLRVESMKVNGDPVQLIGQ